METALGDGRNEVGAVALRDADGSVKRVGLLGSYRVFVSRRIFNALREGEGGQRRCVGKKKRQKVDPHSTVGDNYQSLRLRPLDRAISFGPAKKFSRPATAARMRWRRLPSLTRFLTPGPTLFSFSFIVSFPLSLSSASGLHHLVAPSSFPPLLPCISLSCRLYLFFYLDFCTSLLEGFVLGQERLTQ